MIMYKVEQKTLLQIVAEFIPSFILLTLIDKLRPRNKEHNLDEDEEKRKWPKTIESEDEEGQEDNKESILQEESEESEEHGVIEESDILHTIKTSRNISQKYKERLDEVLAILLDSVQLDSEFDIKEKLSDCLLGWLKQICQEAPGQKQPRACRLFNEQHSNGIERKITQTGDEVVTLKSASNESSEEIAVEIKWTENEGPIEPLQVSEELNGSKPLKEVPPLSKKQSTKNKTVNITKKEEKNTVISKPIETKINEQSSSEKIIESNLSDKEIITAKYTKLNENEVNSMLQLKLIDDNFKILAQKMETFKGTKLEDDYFFIDDGISDQLVKLDEIQTYKNPIIITKKKSIMKKMNNLSEAFDDRCKNAEPTLTPEERAEMMDLLQAIEDNLKKINSDMEQSDYKKTDEALIELVKRANTLEPKYDDTVVERKKEVIRKVQDSMRKLCEIQENPTD